MPDYTVTFQADGATVKTMTVEDGYVLKDSDYPAVPTKTGYTGEWVKYTSAIHSNVTVQAKYTAVVTKYTVTFKADNTVVKTMTVKDGYTLKASDYPTVPAKSGYTGEWVKYTSAIHSNVTVQAKYTAVVTKYTVFFKADGFTVKAIQVNDGYVLQDADYPEVPAKVGCNGAWEKHTAAIHSNVTINAVYSPISSHYTVTFKANGATLKTMTVADGYVLKTSDYPTIPKRAGYTGSWPKTGAIHANTTITAVYTKDSGIVIPPQPTSPGEIMSGGEGEPVEADVPAEDETIAPQGTHVTGKQTVTHEYLTLNGKVARETIKTNDSLTAVLDFIYDESGKPFALKYSTNGTSFQTYYYVLNLQGDVVKLIHYIPGFEYESVATYEYDAWGNVSSSGRLAEINPLRYRGYYYDNETGFYYLQSRYYDPANRRFINADRHMSTGQGFVGTNMFAYCNNSPVFLVDYDGDEAETVEWWAASMWWLCAVDGPIPVGDIIYGAGLLLVGGVTLLTIGDSNIPQVESESDKKASAEDGVNIDTEEETNSAQSSDTKSPKRNKHNKRPSLKAISKQLCKRLGIDPHEIKHEFLGNSGKISRYDLFYDTNTGIIYIISKDGSVIIETYYCVIDKSIHMN